MDPQSSWERATMANGIQEREINQTPEWKYSKLYMIWNPYTREVM